MDKIQIFLHPFLISQITWLIKLLIFKFIRKILLIYIMILKVMGILIRRCENYRNLKWHDYRIAVNAHDANVRLLEALAAVIGKGVCE